MTNMADMRVGLTDAINAITKELAEKQAAAARGDQLAARDVVSLQKELAATQQQAAKLGGALPGPNGTSNQAFPDNGIPTAVAAKMKVQQPAPGQFGSTSAAAPSGAAMPPPGVANSTRTSASISGSGIDVEGMIDSLASTQKRTANWMGLMQDAITGKAENYKKIADVSTRFGEAAAQDAEAEGNAKIKGIQHQQSIIDVLQGGHDPDSVMVQSQIEIQAARKEQDRLRPEIEARDAVTIYDDPLGWLVNQIVLPNMKRQYNNAVMKEATMGARIDNTQQRIRLQEQVEPAHIEQEIRQSVAAKREQATAKAAIDAAQAANASMTDTLLMLQTSIAVNQWDYAQQKEIYKAAAERYHLSNSEGIANRADKQLMDDLVTPLNVKLASVGLPGYNLSQYKTLDGKTRTELMEWSKMPTLGKDPGDAIRILNDLGALGNIAAMRPAMAAFMTDQLKNPEIQKIIEKRSMDPKFAALDTLTKQTMALSEYTLSETQRLSKEDRDYGNLPDGHFAKLNLTALITVPDVQKFAATQYIKEQFAKDPMRKIPEKELWANYLGRVAADPSKMPELAKDMREFYMSAQLARWRDTGQADLAYPKPKEYVVRGMLGSNKAMNVWSQADIERWTILAMKDRFVLPEMSGNLINPTWEDTMRVTPKTQIPGTQQ